MEIRDTLALLVDVAKRCAVYQEFLTRQPDLAQKAIVLLMHDRTDVMEGTWLKLRALVASLEENRAGPSTPPWPPTGQGAHRTPEPPALTVGLERVPPILSPIHLAIRLLTLSDLGRPLEDPLPDTLDSLHNLPILEGVTPLTQRTST